MPHCMDCTNNSRKTTGISYRRISAGNRLRQAWLATIRRTNQCSSSRNNQLFCLFGTFPLDCFEENIPRLMSGFRNKRKLKANSVQSIFPPRRAETSRSTSERRNLKRFRRRVILTVKRSAIFPYLSGSYPSRLRCTCTQTYLNK